MQGTLTMISILHSTSNRSQAADFLSASDTPNSSSISGIRLVHHDINSDLGSSVNFVMLSSTECAAQLLPHNDAG